MTGISEIRYEKLSRENIRDAYELYKHIKGYKLGFTKFEKKYDTSYCGVNHICYLAYDDKVPVGFYGTLPFIALYRNEKFLAAQACDSITLDNYRGKGIHFELATRTYDELKKHGAKFVFALHSKNTFEATKKLNWKEGTKLTRYHVRISTLSISKVVWKFSIGKSSYRKYFEQIFAKYFVAELELENPLSREGFISYSYSPEYFSYKNFTPKYFVKIGGCIFWIKLRSVLEVGNVWFETEEQLSKAIQKFKKLCFKVGINEIQFHASEGSRLQLTMNKLFDPQPSWLVGYLLFDENIDEQQIRFHPADLDTF